MNKALTSFAVSTIAIAMGLSTGCEWSGGGGAQSFNTSQGAGVNINFSGFYKGLISGGRAVSPTSSGNITSLTISQSGNRVDVVDSQGSHYDGSIGSPGTVAVADENGNYPAGAELVQSQISFTGHDNVSAREISFVGVIHVITVTDIQGTKTENSSSTQVDDVNTVKNTHTENDGTTTTITETETLGVPNSAFFKETITVTKIDNATGKEISHTVTTTGTGLQSQSATTEFSITEANSQYRLEGTWIETDGVVGRVDAKSSGSAGVITTTTTTPTPTPTT